MRSRTTVKVITCPRCGYGVYSRNSRDFRECPCKGVHADGGFTSYGGKFGSAPELLGKAHVAPVELPVSRRTLYNDWNRHADVYGLIPPPQKQP